MQTGDEAAFQVYFVGTPTIIGHDRFRGRGALASAHSPDSCRRGLQGYGAAAAPERVLTGLGATANATGIAEMGGRLGVCSKKSDRAEVFDGSEAATPWERRCGRGRLRNPQERGFQLVAGERL